MYLFAVFMHVCIWQVRVRQTEAQPTVESSGLQVIVTHPSPCATPALSPQTPAGTATAATVWILSLMLI